MIQQKYYTSLVCKQKFTPKVPAFKTVLEGAELYEWQNRLPVGKCESRKVKDQCLLSTLGGADKRHGEPQTLGWSAKPNKCAQKHSERGWNGSDAYNQAQINTKLHESQPYNSCFSSKRNTKLNWQATHNQTTNNSNNKADRRCDSSYYQTQTVSINSTSLLMQQLTSYDSQIGTCNLLKQPVKSKYPQFINGGAVSSTHKNLICNNPLSEKEFSHKLDNLTSGPIGSPQLPPHDRWDSNESFMSSKRQNQEVAGYSLFKRQPELPDIKYVNSKFTANHYLCTADVSRRFSGPKDELLDTVGRVCVMREHTVDNKNHKLNLLEILGSKNKRKDNLISNPCDQAVVEMSDFYADITSTLQKHNSQVQSRGKKPHHCALDEEFDRFLRDFQKTLIRKTKNNIKSVKKGNIFDHLAEWRDVDPTDPAVTVEVFDKAAIKAMMQMSRKSATNF